MRQQSCLLRFIGGLVSLGLALLIFGVAAFFFLRDEGGTLGTFISTLRNVATLGSRTIIHPVTVMSAGGDGLEPDLLIMSYQLSGSPLAEALATPNPTFDRGIPIILSATTAENGRRTIRWETELGTDEENKRLNYAVGETAVYVTINDQLHALDKADGHTLWLVRLSDAVSGQCGGCIVETGEQVILLTADNVLQVLDRHSGQGLWTARLNEANPAFNANDRSPFAVTNGQIAIIDRASEEAGANRLLAFYDLATGKLTRQLAPQPCTEPESTGSDASDGVMAAINSAFSGLDAFSSSTLVDAAHDRLYFVSGGTLTPSCLQAWQVSSGQLLWSTIISTEAGTSLSFNGRLTVPETAVSPWLIGQNSLYLTLSSSFTPIGIMAYDLDTGQTTGRLLHEDYGITSLAEVDGTLFVRAIRQRGTERNEIWGVTADTLKTQWQYELLATDLLQVDGPATGSWSYHPTRDGLALLQLVPAPDRVLAQIISPEGKVLTEGVANVGDSFWLYTTWTNDTAYMVIRDLFAVDLTSGKTTRHWP